MNNRQSSQRSARTLLKTTLTGVSFLAGSALAAAGGWWLYSRLAVDHKVHLPFALDARHTDFFTRAAGRLSCYYDVRGEGTPLVLLHSVNAAASAFEMKPLFERFRGERPVYALELPGFGFSNRADRVYTPELFTEAVLEFLEAQVGEPADVVAPSLSGEFAARAALQTPEQFSSLALVSPTGLNTKREARASDKAGEAGGNDTFYKVASQPLWARAFYDLIATPASIHYFLQQSFVGEVPQDLKNYSYLSSHQPGAEHAPLYFISGKLFTPDVRRRVYERLTVPTLVLFDGDAFVSFEKLPELLVTNQNVRAVQLKPSRGLPQFDLPEHTVEVLETFWQDDAAFPPATVRTVVAETASRSQGNTLPRTESLDSSLALLNEGYAFISSRCDELDADVFETRLLLQKTICMRGRDAAELFYDRDRFERAGAAPRRMTQTLTGQGGVQGLDGAAHTHRKAMFMALMTQDELGRMVDLTAKGWRSHAQKWTGARQVVLFGETMELLLRSVCEWAGVPLQEDEVARRTNEMADLISSAASVGPHYLEGRLARHDAERWTGKLIRQTRSGALNPPGGKALQRIATHRDLDGNLLDEHDAAVELLNVLRPTVAVARYIVFCALALHEYPEWREKVRDEAYLEPFVNEVRRFYPFFPVAAARVKNTFDWRGCRFEGGTRALLDLYGTNHDPALWQAPEAFKPERFLDWAEDPFALVPQGGGSHYLNHRCAGEWLTVAVMKAAVKVLTGRISYDVPPQDLSIDLAKMPALPASGFVIDGVRLSS